MERKVIQYAKKNREAKSLLAVKEYKRFSRITLTLLFLCVITEFLVLGMALGHAPNWVLSLSVLIPILSFGFHMTFGKSLYAKNYNDYAMWYEIEVKLKGNLHTAYYDIKSPYKDKEYRKNKYGSILCTWMIFILSLLTYFVCNKFQINPYSPQILLFIFGYVALFIVLISDFDAKMEDARKQYYICHMEEKQKRTSI